MLAVQAPYAEAPSGGPYDELIAIECEVRGVVELSRSFALAAHRAQVGAFGVEHLDAVVAPFENVDVAGRVGLDTRYLVEDLLRAGEVGAQDQILHRADFVALALLERTGCVLKDRRSFVDRQRPIGELQFAAAAGDAEKKECGAEGKAAGAERETTRGKRLADLAGAKRLAGQSDAPPSGKLRNENYQRGACWSETDNRWPSPCTGWCTF